MENMFWKDMTSKMQGLDKFMAYQEQKAYEKTNSGEYADIQDTLNNLNASDWLDEPERIQLFRANIMLEILKSINQLNNSVQELNEDTNF